MSYENIRNHYERLVFDEIQQVESLKKSNIGTERLEDVACVALNHLPSRYVKHSVDLIFYLTAEERDLMSAKVRDAVSHGYEVVQAHKPHD